jgi:hypothetical protein
MEAILESNIPIASQASSSEDSDSIDKMINEYGDDVDSDDNDREDFNTPQKPLTSKKKPKDAGAGPSPRFQAVEACSTEAEDARRAHGVFRGSDCRRNQSARSIASW